MRLLNERQTDALKELINIGVGGSVSLLDQMINHPIKLHVPRISVFRYAERHTIELWTELKDQALSAVKLQFDGAFKGNAEIVFPPKSANNLVAALTGESEEGPGLDSVRVGTLLEVGNIVLNGVMGSLGNHLEQHFTFSLPAYQEDTFENLILSNTHSDNPVVLLATAHFDIVDLQVNGEILALFELSSFEKLKEAVDKIT
ncbi:MAG: chemotaxis protein CheC [Ignavibacteriales bacterium]|nr:chemotaxis protein CheC [Ignavibacteriales bacterium]